MSQVSKPEKLHKLLSELQDALDDGAVAVVEGPNDAKALNTLGITGKIAQLSKKPISALAEELSGHCREAIILTDFDTYGEKAMRQLRDSFSNECITPNTTFRTRFKKLLGYTEFEDVPALFENEINR